MLRLILILLSSVYLINCGGGSSGGSSTQVEPQPQSPSKSNSELAASKDISLDKTTIASITTQYNNVTIKQLVIGQQSQIHTNNLSSKDISISLTAKNQTLEVSPEQIDLEQQLITFTTPINCVDGSLSLKQNSSPIASSDYQVLSKHQPIISSIYPEVASPGSSLTISGELNAESYKVLLDGVEIASSAITNNKQVIITLPTNSSSGLLSVSTDEMESNQLFLKVERELEVSVMTPEALELNNEQISFVIGAKEYFVDQDFTTSLPVANSIEQIQTTIELGEEQLSHFYSAIVLPDMDGPITVDAQSTAISWIFLALGASNSGEPDSWRQLYQQCLNSSKVAELAEYIVELQNTNFEAWRDLSDTTLRDKLIEAILELRIATSMSTARARSDSYKTASESASLVVITQDPINGDIYINDENYNGGGKLNNGSVSIINDTRLYMSLEATTEDESICSSGSRCIVNRYQHIQNIFDMSKKSVIPPKDGLLGIAKTQTIHLDGIDSNLEIITAGYEGETDKQHISNLLKARVFIHGVVLPSLNISVGSLLGKHFSEGRWASFVTAANDFYGVKFVENLASKLGSKQDKSLPMFMDLFIKPVYDGVNSCISVSEAKKNDSCKKLITFMAAAFGYDAEQIAKDIISSAYDRVIKKAVIAIPVAGWVTGTVLFIYDNYDTIKDTQSISESLYDMNNNPSELNVAVDFQLQVNEVNPSCITVEPDSVQQAIYIQGDGFAIEPNLEPKVELLLENQAIAASSLDTVTNTRIYSQFPAQTLINKGSQLATLTVSYGALSAQYHDWLRIVDPKDEQIYFDKLEPNNATPRAELTLSGCGFSPQEQLKVHFRTEDGSTEGEILRADNMEIKVKVPDEAISGSVYISTASKTSRPKFIDILPFGLSEALREIEDEKEQIVHGKGLDEVAEIIYIDSSGNKTQAQKLDNFPSTSTLIAQIPEQLAIGEVKLYVIRDDGLESNSLVQKKLPLPVSANPESQVLNQALQVELSQESGYDIYYQVNEGELQKYTQAIAMEKGGNYKLSTFARVEVNGVNYDSRTIEYSYLAQKPYQGECALNIDYQSSDNGRIKIDINDKDENGQYEDHIICWYFDDGTLREESPYIDHQKDGFNYEFYPSGGLNFETPYSKGYRNGIHKAYYESGVLAATIPYTQGDKDGVAYSYYESGAKWEIVHMVAGDRQGSYLNYYESGALQFKGDFIGDEPVGIHTGYYESGSIKSEQWHLDGEMSLLHMYYETGELQMKVENDRAELFSKTGEMIGCEIIGETGTSSCMP